jgi:hypothetical protein
MPLLMRARIAQRDRVYLARPVVLSALWSVAIGRPLIGVFANALGHRRVRRDLARGLPVLLRARVLGNLARAPLFSRLESATAAAPAL